MKNRQVDLAELHRFFCDNFTLDELSDLCRILRIDIENITGASKLEKSAGILAHFEHEDRLADLINAGKQLKPELSWNLWDAVNEADPSETLDFGFLQYRRFMQEAFTLDELLIFINESEDFKGLGLNLPANATHNSVTRELLAYAQRRDKALLLLEQLNEAKPTLYRKYEPFVENQPQKPKGLASLRSFLDKFLL